jgi:hypothetical protein
VNPGPSLTRRIVVLEQAYFCVKDLPCKEHWNTIDMHVDTESGVVYCNVNEANWIKIFKGLPQRRRLYPCMMAINKGQLIFEIVDVKINQGSTSGQ